MNGYLLLVLRFMWRFAYRRYGLNFRNPMRTAHGVWTTREGIVVRLTDAQGKTGYGEAAPVPGFPTETVDEIEMVCRTFGEVVEESALAVVPGAMACLRFALATARGEWGAPTTVAHPHMPVAALLPAGRAALDRVSAPLEAGFRTLKWKIGVFDLSDELAMLDDVLAQMPSGAKLRLDANGALDRRKAELWLVRCAERPIEYLEQPVDAAMRGVEDVLVGLAGDYPTPIALDESVIGPGDLDRWLQVGWPGIFVLKPALLGDPVEWMGRLETAKARVVFSSALETAIGARGALRAAFAYRGESRALGFGVWPLFEKSSFDGPFAAPFIRYEDVESLSPEETWNALN